MAIKIPARVARRKVRKGKNKGVATRVNTVDFGEWGLKSLENERITARQIESGRVAITGHIKRGGRVWIRIFPHTPVSKKPLDVKMGGGKGEPDHYVAKIKAGTIIYEMADVTEEQAREALRLAGHKMPVKTKVVKRGEENE